MILQVWFGIKGGIFRGTVFPLSVMKISLLLIPVFAAETLFAQAEPVQSAWQGVNEISHQFIERSSPLERDILKLMTSKQFEDYLNGASPHGIVLGSGETLGNFLERRTGVLEIVWHSIDGGGGKSSNRGFSLKGTIGQPDAGHMVGGDFSLAGGFWVQEIDQLFLFSDGFETGDTSNWDATIQ